MIDAYQTPERIIHLIRHGETDWNREKRAQGQLESVLTDDGRKQAQTLALAMRDIPIGAVYSSSSVRTRQTTALVFGNRDIPVVYCDQLREICMGPWEGSLYSDIQKQNSGQFEAFWHAPERFSLPGAESFAQVQDRALKRLASILRDTTARHIAIVSHGVLIKTILCAIEPRPLADLWRPPAMHNCARSVISIQSDGNQRILTYCDQPHRP